MRQIAVFEGRVDSLKDLHVIHRRAAEQGITEIACTFRDPRDAILATRLFSAPDIEPVEPSALAARLDKAPLRLRCTPAGDLIRVRRRVERRVVPLVVTIILAGSEADESETRSRVDELEDAQNVLPIVVVDDLFAVHKLRRSGLSARVVQARDLGAVLAKAPAEWLHVVTPQTHIGGGYPALLDAVAKQPAPTRDVLSFEVALLDGRRSIGLSFRLDGGRSFETSTRLGLLASSLVVPKAALLPNLAEVHSCDDVLSMYGLGGIMHGQRRLIDIDGPAHAVGIGLYSRNDALAQCVMETPQAVDADDRIRLQAAAIRLAQSPAQAAARILRQEVLIRTSESGCPVLALGAAITNHMQAVHEACSGARASKASAAACSAIEDLMADASLQLAALREREHGLGVSLMDLFDHPDYFALNLEAAVRTGFGDRDARAEDALLEGMSRSAGLLMPHFPQVIVEDGTAHPQAFTALARQRDIEQALLMLADFRDRDVPTREAGGNAAVQFEKKGAPFDAAATFASTYLTFRNPSDLGGVAFNIARLGFTDLAARICQFALAKGADSTIILDILLDVVLPPTRRGERLPKWVLDLEVLFNQSHRERCIHRLLDGGFDEEAARRLQALTREGLLPSLWLRLRLLHARADWAALIRCLEHTNLAPAEQAREIAYALANRGDIALAAEYLKAAPVSRVVAKSILAGIKLQFGAEDEAFREYAALTSEEVGADEMAAKRELIVEAANAGNHDVSIALTLDVLATRLPQELHLFFAARHLEATGNPVGAAMLFRQAIICMAAPNWLRTVCVFMLHRSLHFSGRHEEAVRLFDAFLAENGPFTAIFNEIYLQFRQTFILLNGIRAAGSLRGHELTITRRASLADEAVQSSMALFQQIHARRPGSFIFVFDFQTGDTYLILYFLKKFAAARNLLFQDIVAVCSPRLEGIVRMFADRIGEVVVAECGNPYRLQRALEETGETRVAIAHPEFLTFRCDGSSRVDRFRLDFMLQSKRALGLPVDHSGDHPARTLKPRAPGSQRSVFLAPMSNSFQLLPPEFWNRLADVLAEDGFRIYVNKGPDGENVIRYAKPVDLPHARLVEFLDDVDCIIGLRSGLLDVVSGSATPMIVYYPVPGQAMPWPHMWTLKPLRQPESTHELLINTSTMDFGEIVLATRAKVHDFIGMQT